MLAKSVKSEWVCLLMQTTYFHFAIIHQSMINNYFVLNIYSIFMLRVEWVERAARTKQLVADHKSVNNSQVFHMS